MSKGLVIAVLVVLAASVPVSADGGPARKGSRVLDLRLAPETLRAGDSEPGAAGTPLPPARAAVPPPETASRPGFAIELQPLRRREETAEGSGAASDPRERDALADRLERLGIEEFVIRFVRPL